MALVSGAGYSAPQKLLGTSLAVFPPAVEKAAEGREREDAHHQQAESKNGGEGDGGGRAEKGKADDYKAGGWYREAHKDPVVLDERKPGKSDGPGNNEKSRRRNPERAELGERREKESERGDNPEGYKVGEGIKVRAELAPGVGLPGDYPVEQVKDGGHPDKNGCSGEVPLRREDKRGEAGGEVAEGREVRQGQKPPVVQDPGARRSGASPSPAGR